MRKLFTTSFFILTFHITLIASSYEWTKVIYSDNWLLTRYIIAVDKTNNIYLAGTLKGTVNFAADWGGNDIKNSGFAEPVFVTRINSDGSYGWTKVIGLSNNLLYRSITADMNGSIYLIGNFVSTVNFAVDWGGNDIKTNMGFSGIFITKINADGSYNWTKSVSSFSFDMIISGSIIADRNGNIYLTGMMDGNINFAADWGGNDMKTFTSLDVFVTRINSDGSYGWTKVIGGTLNDIGLSITVDRDNNIYTRGTFQDTVNFAADWGGNDTKTSTNSINTFITKINSDGSYGWTRATGGFAGSLPVSSDRSIVVDGNSNVFIIGTFYSAVNFAADWGGSDIKTPVGDNNVYILKINSDNSYGWTKIINASFANLNSIEVDKNENIYITGAYNDTVNFAADWGGNDIKTSLGF